MSEEWRLPDLYVCEECREIGLRHEAVAHCASAQHVVRSLTREESERVRLDWALEEFRCVRCGDTEHDEEGCCA